MSEHLTNTIAALQERHQLPIEEFRGEFTVFVEPENIQTLLLELSDKHEFHIRFDVPAVDCSPQASLRSHVS